MNRNEMRERIDWLNQLRVRLAEKPSPTLIELEAVNAKLLSELEAVRRESREAIHDLEISVGDLQRKLRIAEVQRRDLLTVAVRLYEKCRRAGVRMGSGFSHLRKAAFESGVCS